MDKLEFSNEDAAEDHNNHGRDVNKGISRLFSFLQKKAKVDQDSSINNPSVENFANKNKCVGNIIQPNGRENNEEKDDGNYEENTIFNEEEDDEEIQVGGCIPWEGHWEWISVSDSQCIFKHFNKYVYFHKKDSFIDQKFNYGPVSALLSPVVQKIVVLGTVATHKAVAVWKGQIPGKVKGVWEKLGFIGSATKNNHVELQLIRGRCKYIDSSLFVISNERKDGHSIYGQFNLLTEKTKLKIINSNTSTKNTAVTINTLAIRIFEPVYIDEYKASHKAVATWMGNISEDTKRTYNLKSCSIENVLSIFEIEPLTFQQLDESSILLKKNGSKTAKVVNTSSFASKCESMSTNFKELLLSENSAEKGNIGNISKDVLIDQLDIDQSKIKPDFKEKTISGNSLRENKSLENTNLSSKYCRKVEHIYKVRKKKKMINVSDATLIELCKENPIWEIYDEIKEEIALLTSETSRIFVHGVCINDKASLNLGNYISSKRFNWKCIYRASTTNSYNFIGDIVDFKGCVIYLGEIPRFKVKFDLPKSLPQPNKKDDVIFLNWECYHMLIFKHIKENEKVNVLVNPKENDKTSKEVLSSVPRPNTKSEDSQYGKQKLGINNVGFRMLQSMGWTEGRGLGRQEQGLTTPVNLSVQVGKSGLGNTRKKPLYNKINDKGKIKNKAKKEKGNNGTIPKDGIIPKDDVSLNLQKWIVIVYNDAVEVDPLINFLQALQFQATCNGMILSKPLKIINSVIWEPEKEFPELIESYPDLQMVMCVLHNDVNRLYERIKGISDQSLNIITKCTDRRTVMKCSKNRLNNILKKIYQRFKIYSKFVNHQPKNKNVSSEGNQKLSSNVEVIDLTDDMEIEGFPENSRVNEEFNLEYEGSSENIRENEERNVNNGVNYEDEYDVHKEEMYKEDDYELEKGYAAYDSTLGQWFDTAGAWLSEDGRWIDQDDYQVDIDGCVYQVYGVEDTEGVQDTEKGNDYDVIEEIYEDPCENICNYAAYDTCSGLWVDTLGQWFCQNQLWVDEDWYDHRGKFVALKYSPPELMDDWKDEDETNTKSQHHYMNPLSKDYAVQQRKKEQAISEYKKKFTSNKTTSHETKENSLSKEIDEYELCVDNGVIAVDDYGLFTCTQCCVMLTNIKSVITHLNKSKHKISTHNEINEEMDTERDQSADCKDENLVNQEKSQKSLQTKFSIQECIDPVTEAISSPGCTTEQHKAVGSAITEKLILYNVHTSTLSCIACSEVVQSLEELWQHLCSEQHLIAVDGSLEGVECKVALRCGQENLLEKPGGGFLCHVCDILFDEIKLLQFHFISEQHKQYKLESIKAS